MSRIDIARLAKCPLFIDTPLQKLEEIISGLNYSLKQFQKGNIVMLRGTVYDHLLLLVEGRLSAEISNLKGKVLKVETLNGPAAIAGPILFSTHNLLPVQLVAETDALVIRISKAQVLQLLQGHSSILQQFLNDSGNKISFLSEKIRLLQLTNIRQKIAFYFLDLMSRQNNPSVKLPYTIETLAELFSVSRPSLSRSLGELVDEGLLARSGRNYIIEDKEGLEYLLEE